MTYFETGDKIIVIIVIISIMFLAMCQKFCAFLHQSVIFIVKDVTFLHSWYYSFNCCLDAQAKGDE